MPDLPIILPFPLIDIAAEGEQFRFLCTEIQPEFRTPEQTEPTDFDCGFAVEYAGRGLSAQFGCDISAGNVYAFYQSLETAYQQLDPEKPAQLANYGSLDRTAIRIRFDRHGGCLLTGHFLNAENHYHSGIQISIPLDQSYICEILRSLRHFFRILTDAQGYANFY